MLLSVDADRVSGINGWMDGWLKLKVNSTGVSEISITCERFSSTSSLIAVDDDAESNLHCSGTTLTT